MKPDLEFLKKILTTLQASPRPWPTIGELENAGVDADEDLCLHLELLDDYGFIQSKADDGSFGFQDGIGGEIYWADVPVRITASGHEFIEAMEKPEIWNVIKSEFKESSIKTIFTIGTSLVEGYAKDKLEKYLK